MHAPNSANAIHQAAVEAVSSALNHRIKTVDVPLWLVKPAVRLLQGIPDFPLTMDQLAMLQEDNTCDTVQYTRVFSITPQSFLNTLPTLV